MLEELRKSLRVINNLSDYYKQQIDSSYGNGDPTGRLREQYEALKTLLSFAQLILDSKGWPARAEYGEKIHAPYVDGWNSCLDLCLASIRRGEMFFVIMDISTGDFVGRVFRTVEEANEWIADQDMPEKYRVIEKP